MGTESISMAAVDVGLRSPSRAKLLILIGAILALAGITIPFVFFALLLLSRGLNFVPVVYSLAVSISGSLLLGIGGFLIFLGFAQARPDSLPWTLVVAVFMVVAGATGAIAGGIYALFWLGTFDFRTADFGFVNLVSLVG